MLTEPGVLPVTVTEQLPELRRQNEEANVRLPEPVSENVTIPIGFEPVTCAAQVVEAPV